MGHLWINGLGIYDLMGGAFMANSVKVENKNKKLNISGYSVLKLPVRVLTIKYFVSTWFSNISICVCCRFFYGLGQGLGAGSGIRGWVRVRALNTYVEMGKDEVFGYNCLFRN